MTTSASGDCFNELVMRHAYYLPGQVHLSKLVCYLAQHQLYLGDQLYCWKLVYIESAYRAW